MHGSHFGKYPHGVKVKHNIFFFAESPTNLDWVRTHGSAGFTAHVSNWTSWHLNFAMLHPHISRNHSNMISNIEAKVSEQVNC